MDSDKSDYVCNEIRIGVVGSVDSGKSTITGVLTKGELDDGRGKARGHILKHKHEKDTGRTSDVSQHFVKNETNIIEYVDLAGHDRYSKTTIGGIKRCDIDYGMLTIALNRGILQITKEHCELVLTSGIPIFIAATKYDIASEYMRKQTLKSIEHYFNTKNPKKGKSLYKTIIIPCDTDINDPIMNDIFENYSCLRNKNELTSLIIPIFQISSVSGTCIELLKNFISKLKLYKKYENDIIHKSNFIINNKYYVKGVGIIASGFVKQGVIKLRDKLFLGPDENGKFKEVLIRSIHNNFKEHVEYLSSGQGGSFNIVFTNSKEKITKNDILKGYRLLQEQSSHWYFNAKIKILNHSTTVSKGYQPTIHIGNVSQSAQIINIKKILNKQQMKKLSEKKSVNNEIDSSSKTINDEELFLRINDIAIVKFKFCHKPEYIDIGSDFIFRESKAKGVGRVLNFQEKLEDN